MLLGYAAIACMAARAQASCTCGVSISNQTRKLALLIACCMGLQCPKKRSDLCKDILSHA